MRSSRTRGAFTLIEVLAVVFLTAILFGAAVNYYVELSTRSNHAAETTRLWRHATGLLDRVAADLERSYLVKKPGERDPLDHPWLFLAESRYAEEGADRIKFSSRRRVDLSTDGPRSDLAFVSYMLRTSEDWEDEEDAQYELLRWSQPGLPTELDRDFPHPDDSQLVADGIAAFHLRFQDDEGIWHERWDSSQLEFSGSLPQAAEIEVAFAAPEGREDALLPPLRRHVSFPLPAIDLETLADPAEYSGSAADGGGEEGDEDDEDSDLMASDCVDRLAKDEEGRTILDAIPGSAQNAQQIADRLDEIPWATAKQFIGDLDHPGVLCD